MDKLIVMNSVALTFVKTSHNDMQTYSFKAKPLRQGIKPASDAFWLNIYIRPYSDN